MPSSPSLFESLGAPLGAGLFLAVFAAAAACTDITPSDNGDQGQPPVDQGPPPDQGGLGDMALTDLGHTFESEHVRVTETGPAIGTLSVDASDTEQWVYVDLDSRTEVMPADPLDDAVWDLAFRRFHVVLNGGVSGTGGVTAAMVDDAAFEAVQPPAAGAFTTDTPDGADEDALPDYVISGGDDPWYAYDVTTHVLTPKARVYVVRSTEGVLFKVAIERYYDGAGGSGHPTLRYARISP